MKKFISILLAIVILISCFSISMSASSVDNVKVHDGIKYSGSVTIQQIDSLAEYKKQMLREDDIILEGIHRSEEYIVDDENDVGARGVIAKDKITKELIVNSNSSRTEYTFRLYVEWQGNLPFWTLRDKIAISWSDNFTLKGDYAGIRKRDEYGFSSERAYRKEVSAEKGVAYELDVSTGDQEFYMFATVLRPSTHGTANVVGGFAHTTLGVAPSVSFGSGGASISFSGGKSYDTMEPIYKAIDY